MPGSKVKQSILAEHFMSALILAAILIFGAAYLFYFKGELARSRAGGEFDVARARSELLLRKEELGKLKSAVAALNSVSMEDREKIDRFLPKTPEEPSILSSISLILRDAGLVLLSVDATPTGEPKGKFPKGLKAVEVTMGIGGGNYAQIGRAHV